MSNKNKAALIGLSLISSIMLSSCNISDIFSSSQMEVSTAPEYVTVSFDARGGTPIASVLVETGSFISVPSSEKVGHTIEGWYTSLNDGLTLDNKWDFGAMPVYTDLNLYANWTINPYTLTFVTNGGSGVRSITKDYGTDIELPITFRRGYSFIGWYLDPDFEMSFVSETMPAENLTLYAKWEIAEGITYENTTILPMEAAKFTMSELEAKYSSAHPLEIDFWTGFSSAITSTGILQAIEQFETEYPWIDVKHTSKGTHENLIKAINLAVSTDTPYPQVVTGYPDHFANHIYSGIQYALDPFMYSTDPDIAVDVDDYVADYMVENRSFQFKDEEKTDPYTHSLPFNKSTEVMVVNQTFMDWIKTYDASIHVPTTWDELHDVGSKILLSMNNSGAFGHKVDVGYQVNDNAGKVGYPGVLLDFTDVRADEFRPFSYDSTSNLFITMVNQWGGQYIEMDGDVTKGCLCFNSQSTIEMLDFFRELHDDQIFAIPTSFGETNYNSVPFVSLKTVMTVSSSVGVYHNVPAANAFRVKIHPVLAKNDAHKYVISTGTNLALLTNNDNEKVLGSWLFLRYLTTTANAKFALNTSYYPVTESGINSKLYQDYIKVTGESEYNMSKVNAAKVNANIYGKDINGWTRFVEPGFMGSNEIREEISTLFLTLFFGLEGVTMSSQEVVDYYYEQLSQYVEGENPLP